VGGAQGPGSLCEKGTYLHLREEGPPGANQKKERRKREEGSSVIIACLVGPKTINLVAIDGGLVQEKPDQS